MRLGKALALFALFLALAGSAHARVVRIQVQERGDLLGGQPFGLAGPYEKLSGRVYFAVDPEDPINQIITDVEKGPRNAQGEVEFSSDFTLLQPKQIERGNGAVFFEVSNRGGKALLRFFNRAPSSLDRGTRDELGDGLLFRQGYTVLWLGWQFDTPKRPGRIRLYTPSATENGQPLKGLVRCDFVVREKVPHHILSDRNHIPYPAADPEDSENVLTVRETVEGPRRTIPRSQWKFARVEQGRPIPDPTHVHLEGGFQPGLIYEVVYVSQNPPVVGLGPASVRDMISFLKYDSSPEISLPPDVLNRAFAFGSSQSGRFLRTFLYHGFNEDEEHRKVLDGVIPSVAGAGRGSFNHRFAQPSRDAQPFACFFYPTDIFPFTGTEQTDPETGITDGLLTHAPRSEFLPKIFYTNSSYEYWGRAASLTHTSVDGKRDVELMDNVRMYLIGGSQHGPGPFPPRINRGQEPSNPMDYKWVLRALLPALDRWATLGEAPPPSRYPRIDQGTLVPPEKLGFPVLPGISLPQRIHKAFRVDYGPRFRTDGIVTQVPPKVGKAFPILVPAVDEDGNEVTGIRLPELSVPLATYTGWNLFNARRGPTHALSSFDGCYIPFPRTEAERAAKGDPRPSIESRYKNRDEYLGRITQATLELIAQGYLLTEDMAGVVGRAAQQWDYVMGTSSP